MPTSVVTVANNAALGTSPPGSTLSGAEDAKGLVNFGSGTSPTTGAVCTLTLAANYSGPGAPGSGPIPLLSPMNAATAALGLYVSSRTTNSFTIGCATAPAASQSVGTYVVGWQMAHS